jgi:quercetin dioxygenase-like cupin family protein
MVATRPPGYHTKPHMHVSEQINHVLEGEIWFFVEDKGYLCKKGDFPAPMQTFSSGCRR